MRIGEILLGHGWVDRASLDRALAEQRQAGKRLCSLLVARGLLELDNAARALGERHGVAAALERHLLHRERALAKLLSAGIGRAACALPIGRMRGGELIVCMRDPRFELRGAVAGAIDGPVVIAVAPAIALEPLVDEAYPDDDSIEVDLSTQPIAIVPDFGPIRLADLDDARVARDPTQSAPFRQQHTGLSITKPPPVRQSSAPVRSPTPLSIPVIASPIPLADAIDALDHAATAAEATFAAMRFAAGRWLAALLLAVRDGTAHGERGHGTQLAGDAVREVALPLTEHSLVQVAHDTGQLATGTGVHDPLARVLGEPRMPAAAPIAIADRIAYVLVVGDPVDSDAAHAFDLDRLAHALGDAYSRVTR